MSKHCLIIAATMAAGSTAVPALATAAPAAAPRAATAATTPPQQPVTRAQLAKNLGAQFKTLDKNGDGVLTKDELAAAQMRSIQQQLTNVRARMDTEFSKLDTNRDGQLSKSEFMAAAPQSPTTAPDISADFAQFDTNKDGKVTFTEYQTIMLQRFDRADKQHKGAITEPNGATVTRADFAAKLPAMFKTMDAANHGSFTKEDLAGAELRIRQQRVAAARQRFDADFTKFDTDKNGQLSRNEFMAAAPGMPAKTPDGSNLLAQLDRNHDNKVTLDEYQAPILARFDALDTNHDGTISATERQAAQAKTPRKR